jgi:hypothetical protein
MTDESAASATQEDTEATTAQEATTERPGGAGEDQDALTPEAARKLRSESKSLRERLKAAETKLTEREKQDLTERERLEQDRDANAKRVTALEADLRFSRVQLVAHRLGVRPEATEDVAKLLDWESISDPDDPKQLERAVRELVKEKPHLSGVSNGADGGAGRGSESGLVDVNQLIRRGAKAR